MFVANPIFDENFEFHINLPELALVRFAVLDDDFIGDEFIGQYTIPFACMQPGNAFIIYLWPHYGIGQAIVFLPFGFFLLLLSYLPAALREA